MNDQRAPLERTAAVLLRPRMTLLRSCLLMACFSLWSCADSYEPGPDSYRLAEAAALTDRLLCVCGELFRCTDDGTTSEPSDWELCRYGVLEAIAPDQIQCRLDAIEQYALCLAEECSEVQHQLCADEQRFEHDLCWAALSEDEMNTIGRLMRTRCDEVYYP